MDPAELFRQNHVPLSRYLFRLTGDSDLAADAAQEAFVKLLERPPREHPKAWLFKVATNLVAEGARTRKRRSQILAAAGDRVPVADPPLPADHEVEAGTRKTAVQSALAMLSEKERTALLMREEGFAQREIADALGTTTKSVGTLIARALVKLADKLELEQEDL